MYKITKEFRFEASHQLTHLPPEHKCSRVHGHSYRVELVLQSAELNDDGFVRDYNELSAFRYFIDDKLDHRHLDDVIDGPSTAENLARFLYDLAKGMWPEVVAVRVSETPKTWAEYRPA